MATKWADLKHKATAEQRGALKREALAEIERIGFNKLREARKQTQVAVAQKLKIAQGAVSRLERQSDFLLSTLREYVEAVGGHLELRAVFPDAAFQIEPLTMPKEKKPARAKKSVAA